MRTERIALAMFVVAALGCSDGIGRPIVGDEPAPSTAGAPGGGAPSAGATSAGASGAGAPGGFGGAGSGGRTGLPDFGGRFSGFGGWDGRREPPPDPRCEGIDQWPEDSGEAEFGVLQFLNFARELGFSCGNGTSPTVLPPLAMKPELQCAARRHSRDMVESGFIGHTNLENETYEDRIRETGYRFGVVGETIVETSGSPEVAPPMVVETLVSDGGEECENLVNPEFDSVGIGYFSGELSDVWTLDFAGP